MNRSKNTAVFLAAIFGVLGLHKFYLGRAIWGVVYLCTSWTYIPMIVGFFDAYKLYKLTPEQFDDLYNAIHPTAESLNAASAVASTAPPERSLTRGPTMNLEGLTPQQVLDPPKVATMPPPLKQTINDIAVENISIPTEIDSSLLDINLASELELAALPGVGPILAKKAVRLRKEQSGFTSTTEFTKAIGLRSHIEERVLGLVSVTPNPQTSLPPSVGRRQVDF